MKKIIFADGYREYFAGHCLESFDDFFSGDAGSFITKNSKRNVSRLSPDGEKVFFVKRFFHPHLKDMVFAFANIGRPCTQAQLEWENANLLIANGIAAYKPVCFGYTSRLGLEMSSFVITEQLDGQCLTEFVKDNWHRLSPQAKEKLMISLGRFVRKIHDKAISLPDLYLWHIYTGENGQLGDSDFAVIDLHRMQRNVRLTYKKIQNLAALNYSMISDYFDGRAFQLLLDAYLGDERFDTAERISKKIEKRTNKIKKRRKHGPRY